MKYKTTQSKAMLIAGAFAVALVAGLVIQQEVGAKRNGGGRLSPASLDLDTPGCPTEFDPPMCEKRTLWTLDKTTDTGPLNRARL
jgi:hypothetical protein